MKRHLITSLLYTVITAVGLGLVYPLLITGLAQLTMRDKADGQLIHRNGEIVGSALLGQPFTGPGYFHSRPSAAGTGYDATASGGSNYAPTNQALVNRVAATVKSEGNGTPLPIDLATASASGLDPDITPAAASYQVARVARERRLSEGQLQSLVQQQTKNRQLGLLGEPRVNVLSLNLALDGLGSSSPKSR